jgi:hypothetical protein
MWREQIAANAAASAAVFLAARRIVQLDPLVVLRRNQSPSVKK